MEAKKKAKLEELEKRNAIANQRKALMLMVQISFQPSPIPPASFTHTMYCNNLGLSFKADIIDKYYILNIL